jgi:hypothetical protein
LARRILKTIETTNPVFLNNRWSNIVAKRYKKRLPNQRISWFRVRNDERLFVIKR